MSDVLRKYEEEEQLQFEDHDPDVEMSDAEYDDNFDSDGGISDDESVDEAEISGIARGEPLADDAATTPRSFTAYTKFHRAFDTVIFYFPDTSKNTACWSDIYHFIAENPGCNISGPNHPPPPGCRSFLVPEHRAPRGILSPSPSPSPAHDSKGSVDMHAEDEAYMTE